MLKVKKIISRQIVAGCPKLIPVALEAMRITGIA
jgi:hypothetical protein